MSNFSRFIFNFIIATFGTFVSIVLGLIAIPFLMSKLGTETFGVTVLFGSIFAIAMILEKGLYSAQVRALSVALANNEMEKYNNIFSTSLNLAIILTFLFTALTWIFAPNIIGIFGKIEGDLAEIAIKCLPLQIFASSINGGIIAPFRAVLASKNRFDLCSAITIGILTFQVISWYLVLGHTSLTLDGWVYSNVGVMLAFTIFAGIAAKTTVKNLSYKIFCLSRNIMRELFFIGGKSFVISLSLFAMSDVYPFLFSIFGNLSMNSIFQSATKSSSVMVSMISNASAQFLPHLTDSYVKEDYVRIKRIYLDATRIIFSIFAVVTALGIIFAGSLFELWLSKAMPDDWRVTANLFSWLLLIFVLTTPATLLYPILLAMNKMNELTIFYVARMFFTIGLTGALLAFTNLGVYSVIVTNLPTAIITMLFLMCIIKKYVRVSILEQIKSAYTRGIAAAMFVAAIAIPIKLFITPNLDTLMTMLLHLCILALPSAFAVWTIGLDRNDRNRILSIPAVTKLKNLCCSFAQKR